MNDAIFRVSAWIDIVMGISGITLDLAYDFLLGRPFHMGLFAKVCFIVCGVLIFKGLKLLELVN